MTPAPRISYAQQAEDIRVWRAFRGMDAASLRYVDVGANEPWHLSITASLYQQGWRGILIEADPTLAEDLRVFRPHDVVVEMAAASGPGTLTFYRVPGTGLGTLDAEEAIAARERGFDVQEWVVACDALDAILDGQQPGEIHFMSIDVEGAESVVLSGLGLQRHRPWVLCIEAVEPGTDRRTGADWESQVLVNGYQFAVFDGVNAWYVANEHADLVEPIAIGYSVLDAGIHGWTPADVGALKQSHDRSYIRKSWQREVILSQARQAVPLREIEQQVVELRTALSLVEASRTFRLARRIGRLGKGVLHRGRVAMARMPSVAQRWIVRTRHARHVRANTPNLTDAAFLAGPAAVTAMAGGDRSKVDWIKADWIKADWINPEGMPVVPAAGLGLGPLTGDEAGSVRGWLAAGPYDDDETLQRRMDNHDDELGRVMAALRTRLFLAQGPSVSARDGAGGMVLVDARCLQSAAFSGRGIGRFARSALEGVRAQVPDDQVLLLIDRGLEPLPDAIQGNCRTVTAISAEDLAGISVLVQPSPMTADPRPLLPVLLGPAYKIAIAYDLIPMHYPTVYLRHVGARAEYAARLDALRRYDVYCCISQLVEKELRSLMGPSISTTVAWPAAVHDAAGGKGSEANAEFVPAAETAGTERSIVIMTGDEPRKNTYGGLAASALATAGGNEPRNVVVIGMAGQETRVHHWSIHAAMRPGEARTAGRVSDAEMDSILRGAAAVVVPSFDEGLSLPVIEALASGATVVAADIPAHRELIGRGAYLADPSDPVSLARAIRRAKRAKGWSRRQRQVLARHRHLVLEEVLADQVRAHLVQSPRTRSESAPAPLASSVDAAGADLRLGLATPWTPQRSGVADFSATIGRELARLCNLTVYTTGSAEVGEGITQRSVQDLLDSRPGSDHSQDALVTVIGNSHFHIPFLQVLQHADAIAVLHDTRMVEYYLALRGPGGVAEVMLRGTGRSTLQPSLEDQVEDMRLLQNLGLWEVTRRARAVIMHSVCAAPLVQQQTSVRPYQLPFANQRVPTTPIVTAEQRLQARQRLGWDDGRIHLASFGYVDIRTKMADVVLESAAWLGQWGYPVTLHFAGAALPEVGRQLLADRGPIDVEITGFLTEEQFRDHLLAVDLGIQLRVSPVLGVSGPLSDLAAWGTPAVASAGLAIDVGAPDYVDRLADDASPLMVAEAIERRLQQPDDPQVREEQRQAYLAAHSPRAYVEGLLQIVAAAYQPQEQDVGGHEAESRSAEVSR